MSIDPDKLIELFGKALAALTSSGILAALASAYSTYRNGKKSPTVLPVPDPQVERLAKLEARVDLLEWRLDIRTANRDSWRSLTFAARLEAERLGYDRDKWPPDPVEPETLTLEKKP